MLNIVNGKEKLIRKNEKKRSIENLQIDYPKEIEKLEEAYLIKWEKMILKF